MRKRLIVTSIVVLISMVVGVLAHNNREDKLTDKSKEDKRQISFFTKDYEPFLEAISEEMLMSDYILEVESTGDYEYVKEKLVQEVKIVRMIKGDHYIVFVTQMVHNSKYDVNTILVNEDLVGMRYLNLSRDESTAYETEQSSTYYKNVKASEFFSNNKETIKVMMDVKHKIIEELGIKPYY